MDRAFCDQLFASEAARGAAQLLIYSRWANAYLPFAQRNLLERAETRFQTEDRERARFATATLTGGMLKDIGITPYLAIRGLISEAGVVLRRAVEHIGVLTHFWHDPVKVQALENPGSKTFKKAFEQGSAQQLEGVKGRFERCAMGKQLSTLYSLLSDYDAHGGSWRQLLRTPLTPNELSCSFLNRAVQGAKDYELLAVGCGSLTFEILTLCSEYDTVSKDLLEGARLLSASLNGAINDHVGVLLRELRKEDRVLG